MLSMEETRTKLIAAIIHDKSLGRQRKVGSIYRRTEYDGYVYKHSVKPYTTFREYDVDYILSLVHTNRPKPAAHINFDTQIGTVRVCIHNHKLRCFKNNKHCAECGLVGNLFLLQQNYECNSVFLEMYHRDEHGLTLFTKDHIFPRSRGGKDSFENLQTMCYICNTKKGNSIMSKNETVALAPTAVGFYWARHNDGIYELVEVRKEEHRPDSWFHDGAPKVGIYFMGWDSPEYKHGFVSFTPANLVSPDGKNYE